MRIEVCSCQSGNTETRLIVVVIRYDGIDGSEVKFIVLQGVGSLDEVLYERLCCENKHLEPLDIGDFVNKRLHLPLTVGQFHFTILIPEGIIGVHGSIRFLIDFPLDMLENGIGNRNKRIVELSYRSLHLQFA